MAWAAWAAWALLDEKRLKEKKTHEIITRSAELYKLNALKNILEFCLDKFIENYFQI